MCEAALATPAALAFHTKLHAHDFAQLQTGN